MLQRPAGRSRSSRGALLHCWKGRSTSSALADLPGAHGAAAGGALRRARVGAIWLHAVSVGEALAAPRAHGRAAAGNAIPGPPALCLSTSAAAGNADRSAGRPAGIDGLFVAPFDFALGREIGAPGPDGAEPSLLVLVETESWPNLIREARRRGAPVAVANGRISERSFPRYRRVRGLLRAHVLAEDGPVPDAERAPAPTRIRALGAPRGAMQRARAT